MTEPSVAHAAEVRLRDLTVRAGGRILLQRVNMKIEAGRIAVIVGGSGAGKSVLLRILAGLLPRVGEVLSWTGEVETGDDQRVGIVFQNFALFDELKPTENIQFAIDHRADRDKPPEQTAVSWLEELGVPAQTKVAGLSGGQKQRLAIARTLAADPSIVLFDEPTSGLDAASGRRVAQLIQATHRAHGRTSIVVTHDYETLLDIADDVWLLDGETKSLVSVPEQQWSQIPGRMQPIVVEPSERPTTTVRTRLSKAGDRFLTTSGAAVLTALRLPYDLLPWFPRTRWGLRFVVHYLRLVGGPSAWVYLALAGMIAGFTTTYFTLRFLPFRLYTQPLLIDELLASIGFALYRILVPVLATILIAARCGAAVAADVGVKCYGGQVDALRTLAVQPRSYLLVPIVVAFVIATPLLEWLAFTASQQISMLTFGFSHSEIGPYYWRQHFFRNIHDTGSVMATGWYWVLAKNLVCGVGTGVIGYHHGMAAKESAGDVSAGITSTVLWTTLFVLVVHFFVALLEF